MQLESQDNSWRWKIGIEGGSDSALLVGVEVRAYRVLYIAHRSKVLKMSWLRSKITKGVIGTATGIVVTGSGIYLQYRLLSAGSESSVKIIAGGILIETGISATVNAVQQWFSDQEEFNYAQFGLNAGIGVFGGVINSVAAWLTATAVNSIEADKVLVGTGSVFVAEVVGGALYGGVISMVQKKAGEGIMSNIQDFVEGATLGGALGGITAEATVRASKVIDNGVSKVFNSLSGYSKEKIVAKVAVGVVGGVISGFLIGTLGKVMENILKKRN